MSPLIMFYPVLSRADSALSELIFSGLVLCLKEDPACCWPQNSRGPPIMSVFIHVVHRNFLQHNALDRKFPVTMLVKRKRNQNRFDNSAMNP